jgi:hypothetical protein
MINLEERKTRVSGLDGTPTKPVHDFADIRRQLGIPSEDDILDYLAAPAPAKRR